MDRRKFLTWVGIGGIASYLPVAIAACSSEDKASVSADDSTQEQTTAQTDNTPRADGFMVIGTVAELDQSGSVSSKKAETIVIRDPSTSQLIALNSLCPHQGCTVKLDAETKNLACPCHGSSFGKDGKVLKGPAKTPLAIYEVKEENGTILVKTS